MFSTLPLPSGSRPIVAKRLSTVVLQRLGADNCARKYFWMQLAVPASVTDIIIQNLDTPFLTICGIDWAPGLEEEEKEEKEKQQHGFVSERDNWDIDQSTNLLAEKQLIAWHSHDDHQPDPEGKQQTTMPAPRRKLGAFLTNRDCIFTHLVFILRSFPIRETEFVFPKFDIVSVMVIGKRQVTTAVTKDRTLERKQFYAGQKKHKQELEHTLLNSMPLTLRKRTLPQTSKENNTKKHQTQKPSPPEIQHVVGSPPATTICTTQPVKVSLEKTVLPNKSKAGQTLLSSTSNPVKNQGLTTPTNQRQNKSKPPQEKQFKFLGFFLPKVPSVKR